jgi:hypothetical protein
MSVDADISPGALMIPLNASRKRFSM